jgi:hypothetical protein
MFGTLYYQQKSTCLMATWIAPTVLAWVLLQRPGVGVGAENAAIETRKAVRAEIQRFPNMIDVPVVQGTSMCRNASS